ncbi:uncharacterized protein LOC143284026 isoform X2 [Babylonia areolata]|uniref:uncharacterized protein LOC143284026 isoform X2 n=1 Tax=Babylonia areolata TaxID=304850 RepID=UPI003FD45C8D
MSREDVLQSWGSRRVCVCLTRFMSGNFQQGRRSVRDRRMCREYSCLFVRLWEPLCCHPDSNRSPNVGACPSSLHARDSISTGQPSSTTCPWSIPSRHTPGRFSLCSVIREGQQEGFPEGLSGQEREDCGAQCVTTPVSVPHGLRPSPKLPLLGSSVCRLCLDPGLGERGCRTDIPGQELVEPHCRSVHLRRSDSGDISHARATSCTLSSLDWQQSETRGCHLNAVSSRVCACSSSPCCPRDHVVGGECVCESRGCVRTELCQRGVVVAPWEDHQCVVFRPHYDQHVSAGVGSGARSPDCRGPSDLDSSCSPHTCPVCPCLRCQQHRLVSPAPSVTRNVTKRQEQTLPPAPHPANIDHAWSSSFHGASDSATHTHSPLNPEQPGARQSSCSQKKSDWTRMVRMRCVGRCLLLLVLMGFGGLFAHVTVTDVTDGHNGVDGSGGGGVLLGGNYQVDILKKLQMRPVPVREFQACLRKVRNKFDLLRIFLADKDISDESLRRLLTASLPSSSSRTSVHSDVRNIAVMSPTDDVDTEFAAVTTRSDLRIGVSNDEGAHPKDIVKDVLSRLMKSQTPNATGKDPNESAEAMAVKEKHRKDVTEKDVPLSRGEKSRRELLKRNIALSKQKMVQHSLRHSGSKSVKSKASAMAYKASENKPVGMDTEQSSAQRGSLAQDEVKQDELLPSGGEASDVKSDVGAVASLSSVAVSDVRQSSVMDEAQLEEAYERVKHMHDEDDYSEGEEVDEEMDYYNDAAHPDAILEELEAAVHHIVEMVDNPQALCRDPRPQVICVQDPKKLNRQMYPACTIVHRCRNDSGCCERNHECGPIKEQVFFRTFLAIVVNTTSLTVQPDATERIAFVNHTECQCLEKPQLPDCNETCPGVFRMHRYGSDCVCDCHSYGGERFPQCDDIKDGLTPLSDNDLVCIKSGKCGRPRCTHGQFDVSSGFCPLIEHLSLPKELPSHRQRVGPHRSRHHTSTPSPPSAPVEGSGDF